MRVLVASLGLVVAIISVPALALVSINDEGIISGAQLIWDGVAANPNQIYVDCGYVRINQGGAASLDVQIPVVAVPTCQQFVTKTLGVINKTANFSFASDIVGGVQANNTAYYVYIADPGATGTAFVISTIAPNQGGEPWTALTWGAGPTTSQEALFLGSYITDGNNDIVPFLKKGDEVTLTPSVSTVSVSPDTVWSAIVTFTPALVYPSVQALAFPAGTTIPFSASELIVDFTTANTDAVAHDARVLNPTLDADVGAGVCTAQAQYYLNARGINNPSSPAGYFGHARIKSAINTQLNGTGALASAATTIEIGGCTAPAAGKIYEFRAAYVGYVEVTHHVSF